MAKHNNRRLRPSQPSDEKIKVMNRVLYARLRSAFGAVRISRQGEARVVAGPSIFDEPGESRVRVIRYGEQYLVACCFCDDDDFKLSVSHRYGQLDEGGRQLTSLAYCHNNNC